MKNFYALFIFILFISLASCRVDEFSPCDNAPGMEGLLCKEFRFENDASIGYLAYYYNSDRLFNRKEYKATDGQLKKYDTYEYETGKLSIEHSFTEEGKLISEKKYTYNSSSNLSNVTHIEDGVEVSYKSFEYTDTLLQKESNYSFNQLDNYTVYQYYNGETNLYRKSLYSAAGELLSYTNIEYFINNYQRHNHYNGNYEFTGYDVYVYDNAQNILRFSIYDATGKLITLTEYNYSSEGQLDSSSEYDEDGKLRKNNKFIYND